MIMLQYANTEIDFTVERLVEIATHALNYVKEISDEIDSYDWENLIDELGLTEEELNFFTN